MNDTSPTAVGAEMYLAQVGFVASLQRPQPIKPRPIEWTVSAYLYAIAKGVFVPALRAELIEGQILEKTPIGDPHAYTTRRLYKARLAAVGDKAVVGSQDPVQLSETSRPEPDAWIATGPDARYQKSSPLPEDLSLICEVADSSLHFDRTTKLALYAKAGILEYWILNVAAKELEQHTGPRADGTYASKRVYGRNELLSHAALGEVAITGLFGEVSDL